MNKSFAPVMILYLVLAEIAQMAVLPPLRDAAPPLVAAFLACPLLPLAGVLAGLLRGEVIGMLVGLMAASLFGFSTNAAYLGPAMVSYGVTAYLAGLAARQFRLGSFLPRLATIGFLLAAENVAWSLTRTLFWRDASPVFPVCGILAATLAGVILYAMLASPFKAHFPSED